MDVVILDIRQEQPTDHDAVYQVVKGAFVDAEHTEQDRVVRLRIFIVAVEDESFMAI